MLSRTILALTTVAALALPAGAAGERGPGHQGRFAATVEAPALTPLPADEQQPIGDTPDVSVVDTTGDDQGQDTQDTQDETTVERPKHRRQAQRFALGLFQRKVWRVSAEADGYDADRRALSVVVDDIGGASKRLAARLEAALGAQVDVLVSAKTRVIGADGHRVTGDDVATALDDADSVKVTGKLAPRSAWTEDEDGDLVPAMRALRIKIVG